MKTRVVIWRDSMDPDHYALGLLSKHYKYADKFAAVAWTHLYVDAIGDMFSDEVAKAVRALKHGEFVVLHGLTEVYPERLMVPTEQFYRQEGTQ